MKSYSEIRKICEKNSRISERVVDDFLIGYAAGHHNLEKKMNQQFTRYHHVVSRFEKGTVNMLKSQFIAHRIFREEGLIGKLLKLPALQRFRGEERDYLLQQAEVPWRFSFSVIRESPSEDFFRMKDIFSGEEYLLFSPGIAQLNFTGNHLLWFNLMAEHDLEMLNTAELKKSFTTGFDSGVYRFTHNKWGEYPHFAQAYFDEKLKLILFTAMTDREKLDKEQSEAIKKSGIRFRGRGKWPLLEDIDPGYIP